MKRKKKNFFFFSDSIKVSSAEYQLMAQFELFAPQ